MKPRVPWRVLGVAMCAVMFAPGCQTLERGPPVSESEAQALSLVPMPRTMERKPGRFLLSERTRLVVPDAEEAAAVAEHLVAQVSSLTGVKVSTATGESGTTVMVLELDESSPSLGPEGYTLDVSPEEIRIRAKTPAGLFYGAQTLRQMIPLGDSGAHAIPCVAMEDAPRFPWRSSMLDVSRHFFSVDYLKRYIDLLATYKINVLHLHLTDDQGWRIEIKKYPKLTEVGAWRTEDGRRYGGFYTQAEMKDLVRYAAKRHITILPEIDVPGHAQAALAAYPEFSCTGGPFEVRTSIQEVGEVVFCAGNKGTYSFLADVLDEVIAIFPGAYIHVGADEVPTTSWERCPKCLAEVQANGLGSARELQGLLVGRIAEHLASRNRKLICWDDLLEDRVPEHATIMFWRTWTGTERIREAATKGHDLILAPISHFYLSGEPTMDYVYSYSPATSDVTGDLEARVLGGTAALWTEHIPRPADVERTSFPQLCAFAEAVWSAQRNRDWGSFVERMWHQYSLLEAEGVRMAIPSPGGFADRTLFSGTQDVRIDAPEIATVRYTLDGSDPVAASAVYHGPIRIEADTTLRACVAYPHGERGPVREGVFERTAPILPVVPGRVVPGLRYQYHEGTFDTTPEVRDLALVRQGAIDSLRIPEGTRNDSFTVEAEGVIHIQQGGIYTFSTRSDDGSRLWIGGRRVVDNWGLHPLTTRTGRITLEAGFYPVRVEFVEATGDAVLDVLYAGPGFSLMPVPAARLFTPVDADGAVVTSLGTHEEHHPERAFDGALSTWFWSDRRPYAGDHLTVLLDPPREVRSLRVLTGKAEGGGDQLRHGKLKVSENGLDYETVAEFVDGVARAQFSPRPLQAIRIQVTEGQPDWLAVREVQINALHHTDTH